MRFSINHNELFASAWGGYLSKLGNRNQKLPSHPGAGHLQAVAAHHGYCIAIFHDEGGFPVVCGRKTEGHPYYCQSCLELAERLGA